ncbi:hypothetical protein D3C72_501410 [compost metagenome]
MPLDMRIPFNEALAPKLCVKDWLPVLKSFPDIEDLAELNICASRLYPAWLVC